MSVVAPEPGLFAAVFEIVDAGVLALDGALRCTELNPAACAMLGLRRADALHRPVADLVAADDLDRVVGAWTAAPVGDLEPAEVTLRHRSGAPVVAVVRARRFADGAVCAVFRQITAGRSGDAGPFELAVDRRVRAAQKLEAMGAIAAGLAHDYNNLLMGIVGCVQLARREVPEGSRAATYLEEASRVAAGAARLTRRIVDFARRRDGPDTLVDLNEVIVAAIPLLRTLLGEGISLQVSCFDGPCPIRGDASRVEQVLTNLAANARDAMHDGGALTVETLRRRLHRAGAEALGVEPGVYAVLRVGDQGDGMDAATQARVFEPFFTTKESRGGSGLGLYVVDRIVRDMGGHVEIDTAPGAGTRFTMWIPIEGAFATRRPPAPLPAVPPLDGRNLTALLVEDDPLVRLTVRTWLEEIGCEVLTACDAIEAAMVIRSEPRPVDLVVTDVMLPGGSGRDVAELVAEVHPGTSVIFMSAHPLDLLEEEGWIPAGATALHKPFTEAALLRTVATVLDARASESFD